MAEFRRQATLEWVGNVPRGVGGVTAGTGSYSVAATFPRLAGEPEGATTPEKGAGRIRLTGAHLHGIVEGLSGVEADALLEAAHAAEERCTISALLRVTVPVTVAVRPA